MSDFNGKNRKLFNGAHILPSTHYTLFDNVLIYAFITSLYLIVFYNFVVLYFYFCDLLVFKFQFLNYIPLHFVYILCSLTILLFLFYFYYFSLITFDCCHYLCFFRFSLFSILYIFYFYILIFTIITKYFLYYFLLFLKMF